MTAAQISALPTQSSPRLILASDDGKFYAIAAGQSGAQVAAFAGADHSHLSANIIDASAGGGGVDDYGKIVKFGSWGGLFADVTSGSAITGNNSTVGAGVYGSSTGGVGVVALSDSDTGLAATSNSGDYHASFGSLGDDRSFVARVGGAFGWWRGGKRGFLTAPENLSDDQTWVLPKQGGFIPLSSDMPSLLKTNRFSPAFACGIDSLTVAQNISVVSAAGSVLRFSAGAAITGPAMTPGTDYAIRAWNDGTLTYTAEFGAISSSVIIGGFHFGLGSNAVIPENNATFYGDGPALLRSGNFQISTGNFYFRVPGGAITYKASANLSLPAGTVPVNTWAGYAYGIDSAGTIAGYAAAANATTGYATEALALAAIPSVPGASRLIGKVTVKANTTAAFTPETDAILGGGTRATRTQGALTSGIIYTAATIGTVGNGVTITAVNPGTLSTALSVSVVGSAITVSLATDGAGVATSTADAVRALLAATPAATALVTCANVSTGLGLYAAHASTGLTGGTGGYPAQDTRYYSESSMGPAVNPCSIWDANYRPTCPDPRGMTCVAGKFWIDIYLTNTRPDLYGTSSANRTIADGNDRAARPVSIGGTITGSLLMPSHSWWDSDLLAGAYGKSLPSLDDLQEAALGATQTVATIWDRATTSYYGALTSMYGLVQSFGMMWVWATDAGNTDNQKALMGGNWASSGNAGSRFVYWSHAATNSLNDLGSRLRSDHLIA